jgi:hypothetical protein
MEMNEDLENETEELTESNDIEALEMVKKS